MTLDTCPSCGQPRSSRYCGHCGERRVEADELSFKRFLHSLADELVPGFDETEGDSIRRMGGRVYRTVYTLFRHPGQLTTDYVAGRRRVYMKPIQVFVVVSVIFFLFGHNYFQFTLAGYDFVPGIGQTAAVVRGEQQRLGITPEAYARRFNNRLTAQKRAVMALTVPLFALGFMPLFRRHRYGEHLVFSIYFFAALLLFMLTLTFAFFPAMVALMRGLHDSVPAVAAAIARGLESEWALVVLVYLPMYGYMTLALQRVYGGTRRVSASKALVLVVWHIIMLVVVFRHTLFFTTFYSIKWLS